MSPVTIIFIVFVGLLVIRVPVAFSLICATVVGIWLSPQPMSLLILPTTMWQGLNSFVLLAIPFFILAGNFLTHGGVARRMIAFATAMVGHWYGGLALAGVLACALFAAVSGSSPATRA